MFVSDVYAGAQQATPTQCTPLAMIATETASLQGELRTAIQDLESIYVALNGHGPVRKELSGAGVGENKPAAVPGLLDEIRNRLNGCGHDLTNLRGLIKEIGSLVGR